jgi:hypothetical protein
MGKLLWLKNDSVKPTWLSNERNAQRTQGAAGFLAAHRCWHCCTGVLPGQCRLSGLWELRLGLCFCVFGFFGQCNTVAFNLH